MNYSTAIFLINTECRAMRVKYEENGNSAFFKTLDQTIKEDDLVVVPTSTRYGMTVSKVVEADVDIDVDTPDEVKWIVQRVDKDAYDKTVSLEGEALKAIRSAELRKKRENLREAMYADHLAEIKALPISNINGDHKDDETGHDPVP